MVTTSQIHERVRTNLERIRTLTGSGTLSVESPEMAGSGSFEIALRKPDSVLLRIEGPFGIEVGSALVTRKEFRFYNSLRNQLIFGATSPANMSRYLRMNVTFDDLLNLFAGSSFLAEDQSAAGDLSIEDDLYVLTYRWPDHTRRYWVDPASLLIAKIQHLDSRGILTTEQRYSNFRTSGDVTFPSDIRFIMNSERRILSVHYGTTTMNTELLDFTMRVPDNAQRVHIQ
jgi:outer membrane lipoprotein-sorting protein